MTEKNEKTVEADVVNQICQDRKAGNRDPKQDAIVLENAPAMLYWLYSCKEIFDCADARGAIIDACPGCATTVDRFLHNFKSR